MFFLFGRRRRHSHNDRSLPGVLPLAKEVLAEVAIRSRNLESSVNRCGRALNSRLVSEFSARLGDRLVATFREVPGFYTGTLRGHQFAAHISIRLRRPYVRFLSAVYACADRYLLDSAAGPVPVHDAVTRHADRLLKRPGLSAWLFLCLLSATVICG